MVLSWSLLAACAMCGAVALFWYTSVGARDLANAAAAETCARISAQLLDGTVAFRRLRPVRGLDGRLGLERTYLFEYTVDGATRRQGFVIVSGRSVESVGLDR
jgi:hypothetical protein